SETLEPLIGLRRLGVYMGVLSEDVDQRQFVALADLVVVEVVRRSDLHRARALSRIGVVISDDRNEATGKRKLHLLADDALVTLVIGMKGDGGIALQRFGPRGGDDDVVAVFPFGRLASLVERNREFVGRAIGQRIAKVPEMTLHFSVLDLDIGERSLELRIPV